MANLLKWCCCIGFLAFVIFSAPLPAQEQPGAAPDKTADAAQLRMPEVAGDLYLLAVGVNNYRQPLKYAASDAEAVTRALGNDKRKLFPRVHTTVLTGPAATRGNILAAMTAISKKAVINDVFMFYFSGKSIATETPSNLNFKIISFAPGKGGNAAQAISTEELRDYLSTILTKRQIVVMETVVHPSTTRSFTPQFMPVTGEQATKLGDKSVLVLGMRKKRIELASRKHGLLTAALLDVLAEPSEAPLTIFKVADSVRERIPQLKRDASAAVYEAGNDYPLLLPNRPVERGESASLQPVSFQPGSAATLSGVGTQAPRPVRRTFMYFATNHYYQLGGLHSPIPNGKLLADVFRKNYGFEVESYVDKRNSEVRDILDVAQERTFGDEDQLVIFISGHGTAKKAPRLFFFAFADSAAVGRNYSTKIPAGELANWVNLIPCRQILLILDTCYSGAVGKDASRSTPRQESPIDLGKPVYTRSWFRAYISSVGLTTTSDAAMGEPTVFTRKLAKILIGDSAKDGVLSLNEIRSDMEKLEPDALSGEFGYSETGASLRFKKLR